MVVVGKINNENYLDTKVFNDLESEEINSFLKENTDWYIVEELDNNKVSTDPNKYTNIIPYLDIELNLIKYKYETIDSNNGIKKTIKKKQEELNSSDYKIIKCYESYLLNKSMPYNVEELIETRQSIRDEINSLKNKLI